MNRRSFLAAALAVTALLAPAPLLAFCQPGDGTWVAAGGRWGLEAPDGSAVIWADSGGSHLTEVRQSETFSCLPPGSTCGTGSVAVHRFCPIDWSPDSRYLLTRDLTAVVPADQYDRVRYGVLERGVLPHRPIDLQRLWPAIEDHWLAKGRDVSLGGGYSLQALGWEPGDANRIVLKASRRLTRLETTGSGADSLDGFLGYWSIATTGFDPRLLAETPDGFDVTRFGKYLGVFHTRPSGFRSGGSSGPSSKR